MTNPPKRKIIGTTMGAIHGWLTFTSSLANGQLSANFFGLL
jgi:hypothetical protein